MKLSFLYIVYTLVPLLTIQANQQQLGCCHRFGHGSLMRPCCHNYKMTTFDDCKIPTNHVGGGSYWKNNTCKSIFNSNLIFGEEN